MEIVNKLDPFDGIAAFIERMKDVKQLRGDFLVADHFAGTGFSVKINIGDPEVAQLRRRDPVIFMIRNTPDAVHKVLGDRMA